MNSNVKNVLLAYTLLCISQVTQSSEPSNNKQYNQLPQNPGAQAQNLNSQVPNQLNNNKLSQNPVQGTNKNSNSQASNQLNNNKLSQNPVQGTNKNSNSQVPNQLNNNKLSQKSGAQIEDPPNSQIQYSNSRTMDLSLIHI